MASCNGFLQTFSQYAAGDIRLPIGGYESLAPYVYVTFGNAGNPLTVGNDSAPGLPEKNSAVITNFQFTAAASKKGASVEIEVHDVAGGGMDLWYSRVNKRQNKFDASSMMEVSFGWVGVGCDDTSVGIKSPAGCDTSGGRMTSPKIYFLPLSVSATYTEGKIKFIISGVDQIQRITDQSHVKVLGSVDADNKGKTLKDSIISILKKSGVKKVSFLEKKDDGSIQPVNIYKYEGEKSKYEPNNSDAYTAVMTWISEYRADTPERMAFVAGWDLCDPDGHFILWKDTNPKCNCNWNPLVNIGTYIVNGGSCSPVIEFSPKAEWLFDVLGASKQGVDIDANGGKSKLQRADDLKNPANNEIDCIQVDHKNDGQANEREGNSPPDGKVASESFAMIAGANANAEIQAAAAANAHAMRFIKSIEADLRIQGDPTIVNPLEFLGKQCALIVVNPFHFIQDQGSSECGDWLARPVVNEVFSNRGWFINGVSHQVTKGSFSTTLSLGLPVPNVEIGANTPVGCTGSGGKNPL